MSISLNVEKNFGSFHLNVQLEAGNEVLALLGASGCGKSMTLKCIAGIQTPDRGSIVLDGRTLYDSARHVDLSPQKRRTGLLFQNYALFPNMTLEQNLRAGARRDQKGRQRDETIAQALEQFGLTDLKGRYPSQLSGGQQQRAALARILVSGPDILLLDEPFSALDSHLRFRLEQELRKTIRQFGKTVILVTHDRDEAYRLADRIAVLENGTVEVCGTNTQVFAQPRTRSAAVLTGCKNISRLEPLAGNQVRATDWGLTLTLSQPSDGATYLGIRMHDIQAGPGENTITGRVVEEIENPFSYTVMLTPLDAPQAMPLGWELDKQTWTRLRAEQVQLHLPSQALVLLKG